MLCPPRRDVLISHHRRYLWHAKQLILKITKKHDKMTYYKVNSWMLIRLERADFWHAKLDTLVIGVSDAYTAARLAHTENVYTQLSLLRIC